MDENLKRAVEAPVEAPVRPRAWCSMARGKVAEWTDDAERAQRWKDAGATVLDLFSHSELRAVEAAERERIAKHFEDRDRGCGGFYDAHEPAEIVRALGPNK